MRRTGLLILLSAAALSQAAPAGAWVRTRTDGCHPVYWNQSCVYIQPDSVLSKDMPADDAKRIIQKAIAEWQTRTTGSFLKLNYVEPDVPREAGFDKQPTIKFRTGKWCRPGACSGDKETCYDPSAAAITTLFYVNKPDDASQDGVILDADIELNAVNNQFYDADKAPSSITGRTLTDLENTLVHELGHFQGLEHTCRDSATPACVVDDQGQRPPLCSDVIAGSATNPQYQAIFDTTMFATAQPREIKKRTPEADDVAGINAIYPAAKDPKVCSKPQVQDLCGGTDSKGCAVSRRPIVNATAALPLALLAAGLLAARLRRRSRSR